MASAPQTDGRRLRAVRTRAAIVGALYELVKAGDPSPTAATIAGRAGVALRSIGQHFPSREALLAAVAEHHLQQAEALPPPPPTDGPLDARLTAFARSRAADLERTLPMRRAIAVMPKPSDAILAGARRELQRRRDELAACFAIELAARGPRVLDRLDVVASGPAWDVMRRQQRQSRASAEAELRALLRAVLRADDVAQ